MVFEKTLSEIVDENYVYARALHYLGISFFEESGKSLRQICDERGLDRSQVIKSFYEFDQSNRLSFKELESYPIELLIEYLKHSHHIFIKEKLPFIVHLARNCEQDFEMNRLLPEFIEDFIYHVYEEEDTVFKYVELLNEAKKGKLANPYGSLIPFRKFSLAHEFDHHQGDDEMKAIRTLVESKTPQSLKEEVLIKEVMGFDREILYHAEIENRILFPRAIQLEREIQDQIDFVSKLN